MKVIENTKGMVYFHAPKSKEKHITKTLTEDLFFKIGKKMYDNWLTDWDGFSWSGEETDAFFDECMPIVRKSITLEVFPRSRYGYDCTMFRFHLDFAGMERDLARKIRSLKLKGKRSSRDRVEGWSITVPSLAFNHVSDALDSIGIKWESSKTSNYDGEITMRKSASEIIRNLENRIALLEKSATRIDMKEVKRYFRNLEDFEYRGEDGYETLGSGGFKMLAEDILKAAQSNEGDFDGFMEAISELGDFYFSTRSYGPDHRAQDELFDLAETFAEDFMG
jgi:hypothetical protein